MASGVAPVLSIIIVNWNTWNDLDECLQSIVTSRLDEAYEIIVVDNASSDGTVPKLRSRYPQVLTVANEKNVGFPKANNQGLGIARGKFVLYLNPDTEVRPNTLATCVSYLRQTPACGLVGCKVLYPDGRIQQECARNFPTLEAMAWESIYFHKVFPRHHRFAQRLLGAWDHEESRPVPCLIGAFMLGRAELLRRLGGLDESVFMFFEDVDLCYRVWQNGFEVHYLSDVSIVHKAGVSQRKATRSLMGEKLDAHLAFFRKHGTPASTFACWLLLLWQGAFRLAASLPLALLALIWPGIRPPLADASKVRPQAPTLRWAAEVFMWRR